MGQKVNPHGIRVGVIKDWDSRWFASKKDFSDNLVEDHKIRTELKAQLKDAGVPKIEIERTVDPSTSAPRVNVNIYCAKPGMVIGKGGAMLKKIASAARADCEEFLGCRVNLQCWVKVKADWRDNEFLLNNFGFKQNPNNR